MSALLRRPATRQTPASPAVSPGDEASTAALARVSPQVANRAWGMLITAALLFCIYLLSNSGRLHIVDEASLFAVTESLALRGQVDTNAIAWTQWVNSPGEVLGAFGPNGEVYSKKGPAPAFLAVPWFLALRAVAALDVQLGMLQGTMLWNGLVTALTAVLLWLTAIRLGYRERTGMALALLFGLATIAWPYARLFFGEPLSAFALLLCFSGILHWRKSGQWPWMLAAGAGAGLAVATVTAHAVLVGILGIYALVALWQRRSDGWRSLLLAAGCFALPLLLAGGLLLGYNAVRFGNPFDTGYHFDSGEGFTTPIWEGFWGLIFSPYRSVFLHTPLLIA
ncbi:MAG: phospholipid carrier-dependent glycosyltransferase, partial [Caldilineaceae bacterium]